MLNRLREINRRVRWLLAVAVVCGVAALAFGDAIRRAIYFQLAINAPTVDRSKMVEFIESRKRPFEWLKRLWDAQKIPHRQLVIQYLREHIKRNGELWQKSRPLVLKATRDVDVGVRRAALSMMLQQEDPRRIEAIRYQLQDFDPAVRRLGIRMLRRLEEPKWLPLVAARLADPHLKVATSTASLLRRWTEKDFGVRHRLNSSGLASEGSGDSKRSNELEKLRHGIEQWKEWWQANRSEYPPLSSFPASLSGPVATLPTSGFRLRDLDGTMVQLADFRGKPVLLNFWTTWCPSCRAEIPKLIGLKRQLGDKIAILGISLDASPKGHTHNHEKLTPKQKATLKKKVRRVVEERGINYTVLHDPKSRVGQRFNGHELPTNVLIGPKGQIHRRFVGGRSVEGFKAIIQNVK